jgi:hypothetical protein
VPKAHFLIVIVVIFSAIVHLSIAVQGTPFRWIGYAFKLYRHYRLRRSSYIGNSNLHSSM